MSETPYRIVELHTCRPSFLAAIDESRRRGDYRLFVLAANWIMTELARTPTEFGESGHYWPHLRIQGRRGFARPLQVDFGVDEENRYVYIRWFRLSR